MATKTNKTETVEQAHGPIPWRARAQYSVGKTRRQRQKQHRQQMNMLMAVVVATVIAGTVFVMFNWREAGDTKTVDCATYPQYCVPLAGGAMINSDFEAESSRELDSESHGVTGVVRYIDTSDVPTLGDPAAPIHFRTVSNFTCGHCNDFHSGDLEKFIENYVLEGQATFGFVLVTGLQPPSVTAAQAALCAGEQGAFWEMSDEVYRLGRTKGVSSGFVLGTLRDSANDMGLNDNKLADCVSSGMYMEVLDEHSLFASDHGITATPTVLVSYGDSNQWTVVSRGYNTLAQLTEEANASVN